MRKEYRPFPFNTSKKKTIVFFMSTPASIILLGMKHCGKTTTGKILAGKLSRPFIDSDDEIAQLSGKTPRELWDIGGAELMMEWETKACESVFTRYAPGAGNEQCVLATGGGIADNSAACTILARTGTTVYLDTAFALLYERVRESARRDGRLPPFLQGPDPEGAFRELFSRRSAIYATIAEVTVETGRLPPTEIATAIMGLLANE